MALNINKNASTGVSPFKAVYGYRSGTAMELIVAGDLDEFPTAKDFIE
jgi:hypothetical protein